MDVLINLNVVIISQCRLYQNITLHTLNLYIFYLSTVLLQSQGENSKVLFKVLGTNHCAIVPPSSIAHNI